MSQSGSLSAADILAYLGQDNRPATPESADRPPEQVQAYREAAAVLVAVARPDELQPVGAYRDPGGVTNVLGTELVPATGRKFDGRVMLAPDVRMATIKDLAATGRIDDALAANPQERAGPLQLHLERYLRQVAPPLEKQSLDELDATRQVAVWLGGVVDGVPTQEQVDARSAYLRLLAPFEAIAGDGVFRGRVKELDELRHYIGVVSPESMLKRLRGIIRWSESERQPAVSISGPGGVGKSALVARFMLEHTRLREDARVPFGYLDFDRASLDVGDPLALCVELLRQLDLQFPGDGRFTEIRERAIRQWADRAEAPSDDRLDAARNLLGDVLDRMRVVLGSRPYVVVLDTFETVQYRGEARAFPLWDMLVKLQKRAPFLRVVVAGRAPVDSLRLADRPPRQIALGELDNDSAMAFLGAQGISDRSLQRRLVRTFGRVPLSLKLVGSLVARTPGGAAALLDPIRKGGSLVGTSDELIQGQLYDRILDHIANPDVRRLAHPGLVLRRVNPAVILHVLKEPCGLGIDNLKQAQELFDELQRETSLVTIDSADGDLVHRADLRQVMLKMLVTSAPAQVGRIRRAAVEWYSQQSSLRARAEEVYHKLHLGDWVDDISLLDREVRPSIQAAVEEYPLQVQRRLATVGFDVAPAVLQQATWQEREASFASQIEELLPYGSHSEKQAWELFRSAQTEFQQGALLARAGARIAAQNGDDREALELIEHGLEYTVEHGVAAQTLGLLQERAWLLRDGALSIQTASLAQLNEHARRNEDRSALLQHRAQLVGLDNFIIDRDLVALGDLLGKAQPLDLWGLVPALRPAVVLARRLHVTSFLVRLQARVQEDESPFRFAVFPDLSAQMALDEVLSNANRAANGHFADMFLRLCDAWPYRILFVAPPYGLRGEQLHESAYS